MLSKMLICSALMAVVAADTVAKQPHPAHHAAKPSPSYAPAPVHYSHPAPHPYKEEKLAPQPFAYQYGVADDYSGSNFKKDETQDEYGNVQGSYTVNLPDGRIQRVQYSVTHEQGYVADVSYEGTPVYPPAPKGGYGHHEPTYKAKPAPYAAKA